LLKYKYPLPLEYRRPFKAYKERKKKKKERKKKKEERKKESTQGKTLITVMEENTQPGILGRY
jgi:hypothetical protein